VADRSFWVAPWRRRCRWGLRVGVVALLVVAFVRSDEVTPGQVVGAVLVSACYLVSAGYEIQYRPFLVTPTATGVLLEANARYFFVPWAELESVRRRPRRHSRFLVWRHRGVGRVWMLYGIVDRDELRAIVERRAPNAELRGW
jgi:hypothetical protein